MISRRHLIQLLGAGALTGTAARAAVPETDIDPVTGLQPQAVDEGRKRGYTPLTTPNGRSLGFVMKDGVKQFHLVAEEIEHEFAPGCRAKCWGYNGSTPGPTIEAVEGERVRILVTNKLPEATSVHWHGILLPNGMDGVSGLTQAAIQPGETWAYEFTLRQAGSHMYHPHADEMVQMALGMMGLFIVHPREATGEHGPPVDRDYAILLHNWALHPGTYRPDPSVMQDFDLWTFNSKVYPATAPLLARSGERVRIRLGNLSMWNHPMHLHGHRFWVTGSDGDRWPRSSWRPEVTHIVGVGQMRDFEFIADNPGDWAFHCHMSHHTMNAMGHGIPNPVGVDQSGVQERIRALLPGYMAMAAGGMEEMGDMSGMPGPENTLPMSGGRGPYGKVGMGGMFTMLKVRDRLEGHADPGWYRHPRGTTAWRVTAVSGADGHDRAGMDHGG
ncbi:MAG: copper oxidase [Nevskia sp.]|nr:copper oxidase [Nevskia sp.]